MKKNLRWLLLAGILVIAVGLVVLEFSTEVTEKKRQAAVDSIGKPEALLFYEQLSQDEPDVADAAEVGADGGPLTPQQIMARWARLFEHVEARLTENADWNALWEECADLAYGEWPEEAREQAEAVMEGLADLLAEVREVAPLGGPVVALDLSEYWQQSPHIRLMGTSSSALRFNARLRAARGAAAGAIEDIRAIMHLGDALAGEPLLESQEVRWLLYWRAKNTLERAFGRGELPPECSHSLVSELAHADRREALAPTIAAFMHWMIEAWREAAVEEGLSGLVDDAGLVGGPAVWLWVQPVCKPWFNQDEQAFAKLTGRLIEVSDLPYDQASPILQGIQAELDAMSFLKTPTKARMSRLMRACVQQAIHESEIDVMQLGILVEAYHAEHGACPDSLEVLAAHFPEGLPVDPFTGEGYHYELDGDRFVLYGLGPNAVDDGGVEPYWHSRRRWAADWKPSGEQPAGDIAWRFEPPPEAEE